MMKMHKHNNTKRIVEGATRRIASRSKSEASNKRISRPYYNVISDKQGHMKCVV